MTEEDVTKKIEALRVSEEPKKAHHDDEESEDGEVEPSVEVHFEPIVKLEAVEIKTLEEEESVFYTIRAKLFRFEIETKEWKERGTGDLKMLQHSETKRIRVVMRRDQTHKICANHVISSEMVLKPNVGSDKSWVYNVASDYSEGVVSAETFAIRFANKDVALEFKSKFEEAQKKNQDLKEESKEESKEPTIVSKTESKEESTKEESNKEYPKSKSEESSKN
jgi:Ran-binding protein 1